MTRPTSAQRGACDDATSIVLHLLKCVDTGDMSTVDDVLATDAVDHGPSLLGATKPEHYKSMVKSLRDVMPDLLIKVDKAVSTGDHVTVWWTLSGTLQREWQGLRPSGGSAAVTGTTLYRIEDGRVQESWGNWDALGMQQQFAGGTPSTDAAGSQI